MATQLFLKKKEQLLNWIRETRFEQNQLPIEEDLCTRFRCSRSMLRDILREIEQEGYISKRHSVGNYVHPSTFDLPVCIDRYQRFHDLIESGGYRSYSQLIARSDDIPSMPDYVRAILQTPTGSQTIYSELLYYADDTPCVVCGCWVPASRLKDEPLSTSHFFRRYKNNDLDIIVRETSIVIATQRISRLMKVPEGKPLLRWVETYRDYLDAPVCVCDVLINLDILPLKTIRKYQEFDPATEEKV